MSGFRPFNPANYDPSQSLYSYVPPGQYKVVITNSTVKGTGDGNGPSGALYLDLKVTEGQHSGALVNYVLNIYHEKPNVAEIAMKQLSALCYSIGHTGLLNDPAQLHNRPFIAEFKDNTLKGQINRDTGQMGPDRTVTNVARVFDLNGNAPTRQAGGAQQPQQQAAPPPPPPKAPQQAPQQAAQPPQQPQAQWGAPPAAQAPQQPPQGAAPQWGQPPAQQPPAAPPGAWGGPPQGAAPQWGAPPQG